MSDAEWLPGEVRSGRAAQRDMLLGPFFAVSGLLEDSADVKQHYLGATDEAEFRTLAATLQHRLAICRVGSAHKRVVFVVTTFTQYIQHELYKVTHSILKCPETRGAALDFIEKFISINAKKAQLHVSWL